LVLPVLLRRPWLVIVASVSLYAATCHFDWNLPAYPENKVWFFNPLAWQVVFYVGAALAVLGPELKRLDRFRRPISVVAALYLLFAAFITLGWHYNPLQNLVPNWITRILYPIDKTNVDILRFAHFLAIAWLVRLAVPSDAAFLKWRVFE